MKSLIVIYTPTIMGATVVETKKRKELLQEDVKNIKQSNLYEDFHCLVIQDPDRKKVEVEVFFKPEKS
jgi:hypothetical protein